MQSRIRALLDANILVSYLLSPASGSPVSAVVEGALKGDFTLLLTPELVAEVARSIASKPYLARRIGEEQAVAFVQALAEVGEVLPPINEPLPRLSRDCKDDYLLAYAVVGEADVLVTGDVDLLVLGKVEGLRIVRPADFAELLGGSAPPVGR